MHGGHRRVFCSLRNELHAKRPARGAGKKEFWNRGATWPALPPSPHRGLALVVDRLGSEHLFVLNQYIASEIRPNSPRVRDTATSQENGCARQLGFRSRNQAARDGLALLKLILGRFKT